MSKKQKSWDRLMGHPAPKDFRWGELIALLLGNGFSHSTKGKTSGSRHRFYNEEFDLLILLHKPHPGSIINEATIEDVRLALSELERRRNGKK